MHLTEPRHESSAELTQIADDAVRNHFLYRAERTRSELRDLLHRGRISLVIGLAFAGACTVAANALGRAGAGSDLYAIGQENLGIVGWVAMWRPLEIFLYDWWPVRRRLLAYRRLANMRTRVVCDATGASA